MEKICMKCQILFAGKNKKQNYQVVFQIISESIKG